MSELGRDIPPTLAVFSAEYWGDIYAAPELDKKFSQAKAVSTTYPELASKMLAYLSGEEGISLPQGTFFDPNNSPSNLWFADNGTLLVFDWERLETYNPDNFAALPEWVTRFLLPPEEAEPIISQDRRTFLLNGESPAWLATEPYSFECFRRVFTSHRIGDQIATYERAVMSGVIETKNSFKTCLNFKIPYGKVKKGKSLGPRPLFSSKQIPFEVGRSAEIAQKEMGPRKRNAVVERVKSVDIIEFGDPRKRGRKIRTAEGVGELVLKPVPTAR